MPPSKLTFPPLSSSVMNASLSTKNGSCGSHPLWRTPTKTMPCRRPDFVRSYAPSRPNSTRCESAVVQRVRVGPLRDPVAVLGVDVDFADRVVRDAHAAGVRGAVREAELGVDRLARAHVEADLELPATSEGALEESVETELERVVDVVTARARRHERVIDRIGETRPDDAHLDPGAEVEVDARREAQRDLPVAAAADAEVLGVVPLRDGADGDLVAEELTVADHAQRGAREDRVFRTVHPRTIVLVVVEVDVRRPADRRRGVGRNAKRADAHRAAGPERDLADPTEGPSRCGLTKSFVMR